MERRKKVDGWIVWTEGTNVKITICIHSCSLLFLFLSSGYWLFSSRIEAAPGTLGEPTWLRVAFSPLAQTQQASIQYRVDRCRSLNVQLCPTQSNHVATSHFNLPPDWQLSIFNMPPKSSIYFHSSSQKTTTLDKQIN